MSGIVSGIANSINSANNADKKEIQKFSNSAVSETVIKELKDEYISSKKKRGLLGRYYAGLTNLLPFGISSRKVKDSINDLKDGYTDNPDIAREMIARRESSVAFGTEMMIDSLATLASLGTGFIGKDITALAGKFSTKLSGKTKLITACTSIGVGFATKYLLKAIDLIGKPKEERQNKQVGHSLLSAAVDGLGGYASVLTPYMLPVTFLTNLVIQHSKEKSRTKDSVNFNNFTETLKDNFGGILLSAATIGIIGAKGHINYAKLAEASKRVKVNANHVNSYIPPKDQLTEFQQLARDIGYDLSVIIKDGKVDISSISKLDDDFLAILMDPKLEGNIEAKIQKLEAENIFLPKYLQTVIDISDSMQERICSQIDELSKNRGKSSFTGRSFDTDTYAINESFERLDKKGLDINGLKDLQAIVQSIKSNCPKSREIEQAQKMLTEAFPNGGYKIEKLLGVGSIAESYLAKDASGNEVVIKIVKQHFLDGDKIAQDKTKILKKIEMRAVPDYSWFTSKQTIKTSERKQYDIEQINNMYKVWGDEINLSMEATSAQEIATQASKFRPVDVIESSNNIFIMQKAQGVQMDSSKFVEEWKKANLTEEDFTKFVENYVEVYCEQLFSLPKNGQKVVQSDPHGGNILVDVAKIRNLSKGEVPITIIDYGNTTKTERKVAIKNLFNHIDYLVGNTDEIAKAMLEGTNCSNKKEMTAKLSQALKEQIYNTDTKIEIDNPVKIFSTVNGFCLNFLQKNNVIPNAAHINQMKAEETYIISNLGCLRNVAESCGYDLGKAINKNKIIKILLAEMTKAVQDSAKYEPALTAGEIAKRYNFFAKNPEEALTSLAVNFGI